jgi:hypothetical protein
MWGERCGKLYLLPTQDSNVDWCAGAEISLAYNALDKHVYEGWEGHTALR